MEIYSSPETYQDGLAGGGLQAFIRKVRRSEEGYGNERIRDVFISRVLLRPSILILIPLSVPRGIS